jgi:hypothetical protein
MDLAGCRASALALGIAVGSDVQTAVPLSLARGLWKSSFAVWDFVRLSGRELALGGRQVPSQMVNDAQDLVHGALGNRIGGAMSPADLPFLASVAALRNYGERCQ